MESQHVLYLGEQRLWDLTYSGADGLQTFLRGPDLTLLCDPRGIVYTDCHCLQLPETVHKGEEALTLRLASSGSGFTCVPVNPSPCPQWIPNQYQGSHMYFIFTYSPGNGS